MKTEKPPIIAEKFVSEKERKIDFFIRYAGYISLSIEGNEQAERIIADTFRSDDKVSEIYKKIKKNAAITDEDADYLKNFFNVNFKDEELNFLLERFETKVFLSEKPEEECSPEAKRVLLYATDPIYKNVVESLIKQLDFDKRCKAIGLITDGVAERNFERFLEQHSEYRFKAVAGGEKHEIGEDGIYDADDPVFVDALKTAEGQNPYDIVVTTMESINSPCASSYWNSKSNFGAKKMYMAFLGWIFGRQDIFKKEKVRGVMDSLDGVFCVDELSRDIAAHYLPDLSHEKFYITGSPIMDEIKPEKAEEFRTAGRKKLDLADDETAVLFLGDLDEYHLTDESIDERINEKTFQMTFRAMIELAQKAKSSKFALLVRPHPRDKNKQELLDYVFKTGLPKNLRIIAAGGASVSMEEARCASDMAASIHGTENHIAAKLGKPGIFLGYKAEGKELGSKVLLNDLAGEEIVGMISKKENFAVAESPEEFIKCVMNFLKTEKRKPKALAKEDLNCAQKICDIILAESN